jgi:hypothetical protein
MTRDNCCTTIEPLGSHCWNTLLHNGKNSHWWNTLLHDSDLGSHQCKNDLRCNNDITLVQQWPTRCVMWCDVKNTFGMSVYSKEYNFSVLLSISYHIVINILFISSPFWHIMTLLLRLYTLFYLYLFLYQFLYWFKRKRSQNIFLPDKNRQQYQSKHGR